MNSLPDYLLKYCEILEQAFPKGVEKEECLILLYILHSNFSQRNLALLISECFRKDYYEILHNLYGIDEDYFHPDKVNEIKDKLSSFDFFELFEK